MRSGVVARRRSLPGQVSRVLGHSPPRLQLQLSPGVCRWDRRRTKVAKQDFCWSVVLFCFWFCFPSLPVDKTGQGVFVRDRQGREVFQK